MIKKIICLIFTIFLTSGISYTQEEYKTPQKPSKQQIRDLQTRTYPATDTKQIMKAVLNICQDNYFFVNQADSKVGFINASKEFDTRDKYINIKEEFGCSKKMTGIKRYSIAKTEANINITKNKDNSSSIVRVSFRKKVLNMYDVEVKVDDITEKAKYDEFFDLLEQELGIKAKTE